MKEVILAIETSCDDTSAAIAIDGIIKSNIINSQDVHSIHGGVVPEISSREHQKNIILVVEEALKSAKVKKNDLNAISFTILEHCFLVPTKRTFPDLDTVSCSLTNALFIRGIVTLKSKI